MTLTFVELSRFSALREEYFGGDEHFRALQMALLENPERGDVIPGAGGVRKMRWPDPRRGKGKRSGLRVIYLHIPEVPAVVFFAVYDKDEATDLTAQQKRIISVIADEVKTEVIKAMHSKRQTANQSK